MEEWVLLGTSILLAILFTMFFLYKRIASIFAGFYYNKASHLVIVTQNSQHEIEWKIWSYFFWNRIIGKKGVITCIDTGSKDDTLKILRRLKVHYSRLDVVKLHPTISLKDAIQAALERHNHSSKEMIVLDLQELEPEYKEKNSA